DEAAVAKAVHLQPPKRPGRLEFLQGLLDCLARKPVAHIRGELLDDLEVATDRRMDPEELPEHRPASVGLGLRVEARHRTPGAALELVCPRPAATRSRTRGATSWMKVRSVSGSGGAIRANVPKPKSRARWVRKSTQ